MRGTDCDEIAEQLKHLNKHVEKLIDLIQNPIDFSHEDRIVRRATRKVKAAKQRIPQPSEPITNKKE